MLHVWPASRTVEFKLLEETQMIPSEAQWTWLGGSFPDWIQAWAVVAGVGAFIVQRRTHDLQALLFVLEQLGSEQMRDRRAWVIKELPKLKRPLTDLELAKARTVCVALDRVAFLHKMGALDGRVFYWFIPGVFEQLWDALDGFILETRQPRGGNDPGRPDYCKTLEWFIKRELPEIMRRQGRNARWASLRADPALPPNWDL
ncbi:MAG: hypothetical protein C0504_12100 [Candidatus Solibacter sp.]|nr:hypothetical protein [Candidatus Solibacter sp.]